MAKRRQELIVPKGENKILLHVCCAPCSGGIIETLQDAGIALTVFFFNPNIHPRPEYEKRKAECMRFCEKRSVPFVDADYDTKAWFAAVKGLEKAPERGERCSACFTLRLMRTADYAAGHSFKVFATTNGISRWKDMAQVNACGAAAAAAHPGLTFWNYNWRKASRIGEINLPGGSERMREVTTAEHFYQQDYCGCIYSRGGNRAR